MYGTELEEGEVLERRSKQLRFHNVGYVEFPSPSSLRSFREFPLSPSSIILHILDEEEKGQILRQRRFFRVSVRLRKIDAFRRRLTSIITVEATKWNNTPVIYLGRKGRRGDSGSLRSRSGVS